MRERQCHHIVLPAYNEERSLPRLLDRIIEAMTEAAVSYQVIVVNDGSQDLTARIAEQYARNIPLLLHSHSVNMGLGATMRDGLLKALEVAKPHDIIITMDADNSHNPELIPRMGRLIREGNDVVIASRYQPGSRTRGVPSHRLALSYAARILFKVAFPIRGVRDYTCGYRAYSAAALQSALDHYGRNMFDQEGFQGVADILLKLRRFDLTFTEVPMILRYDLKEGASKMKIGRTVKNTLFLMLKRLLRI